MFKKADIQMLALTRLREAKSLMEAGYASGAYYLGGYSVELAFKACIAATFEAGAIPEKQFVLNVYTHDLDKLCRLAQLDVDRQLKEKSDPLFAVNWEYIKGWSETARYEFVDGDRASSFISALLSSEHGVFEWIRSHW